MQILSSQLSSIHQSSSASLSNSEGMKETEDEQILEQQIRIPRGETSQSPDHQNINLAIKKIRDPEELPNPLQIDQASQQPEKIESSVINRLNSMATNLNRMYGQLDQMESKFLHLVLPASALSLFFCIYADNIFQRKPNNQYMQMLGNLLGQIEQTPVQPEHIDDSTLNRLTLMETELNRISGWLNQTQSKGLHLAFSVGAFSLFLSLCVIGILIKKSNNQLIQSKDQSSKIKGLRKELTELKTEQTLARIATTEFVAKAAVTAAPSGTVIFFASQVAPEGWLKANGSAVDNITYKALDAAIYVGDTENETAAFGYRCTDENSPDSTRSTDGRFIVVPDLRGEFLRGWDDGRGVDKNRYLGAWQEGTFRAHTHSGLTDTAGEHLHSAQTDEQGMHQHTGTTTSNGKHTHGIVYVSSEPRHYKQKSTYPNEGFREPQVEAYSYEMDAHMASAGGHNHTFHTTSDGKHNHKVDIGNAGEHTHRFNTSSVGDVETRPRNVALLACIKY